MTIDLSWLLLMAQYIIGELAPFMAVNAGRHATSVCICISISSSLLIHILSLFFSSVLFIAFGIIGHKPSTQDNIAKIVLWYTALNMEIIAHFIPYLFRLSGHVSYSPSCLYARASVLFIIVLGQGAHTFPYQTTNPATDHTT